MKKITAMMMEMCMCGRMCMAFHTPISDMFSETEM